MTVDRQFEFLRRELPQRQDQSELGLERLGRLGLLEQLRDRLLPMHDL
jgi:hypothetical protein